VGFLEGRPAVYCSVLHFPSPRGGWWKEHRTVCLPDYQGVGLGNTLSEYVASLFKATGKPYRDTTLHPAHVHHRLRSPSWRCLRAPSLAKYNKRGKSTVARVGKTHAVNRLTMSFDYVGPARPPEARRFGLIR